MKTNLLAQVRAALAGACLFAGLSSPALLADSTYTLDPAVRPEFRDANFVSFGRIAADSAGRITVAGYFQAVNGVPAVGFARLTPSGAVDATNPHVPWVYDFAFTPDGGMWAVGSFVEGATTAHIAKLLPEGGIDPSVPTIPVTWVYWMQTTPDGSVYYCEMDWESNGDVIRKLTAAGAPDPGFQVISMLSYPLRLSAARDGRVVVTFANAMGGTAIAAYDASGKPTALGAAIPPSFNVSHAAFADDGSLIVGGQNRGFGPSLLRIMPTGDLDPNFGESVNMPDASGVSEIVVAPDGTITGLAKLGPWGAGAVAQFSAQGVWLRTFSIDGFQPGYTPNVKIWPGADGSVLVTGMFKGLGGVAVPYFARILANGQVDTAFRPEFTHPGKVKALALNPSGIYVGGDWTAVDGSPAGPLGLLKGEGTIELGFPTISMGVKSLTPTADGGVLVFHQSPAVEGSTIDGFVKLKGDRSVDTAFLAGVTGWGVDSGIGLPDGSVILGGTFGMWDPNFPARVLMKVTAAGTIDPSFNRYTDVAGGWGMDPITSVAASPDGRILVAGSFDSIQGFARPGLAMLTAAGLVDPGFVPGVPLVTMPPPQRSVFLADGRFYQLAARADTGSAPTVLRFNRDGSLDATFAPPLPGQVTAFCVTPDGALLMGVVPGPTGTPCLMRVLPDGTIDPTFNFVADGAVLAITLDGDERIVFGGAFTTINGQPQSALARLTKELSVMVDPAAAQDLQLHASLTLAAHVSGAAGAVDYQWYRDGKPIKGATNGTFTLAKATPSDAGEYSVRVTSGLKAVTSAAVHVAVGKGPPAKKPKG